MSVGITTTIGQGADVIRAAGDSATGTNAVSTQPPAPSSSGVALSNTGTRGNLNTNAGPATVTVTNSTDLNALAEAVVFTNLGEHLTITGSQFTRAGGGINLDLGTNFSRTLTVKDSAFAADVIKARSFNTAGRDGLLIENSRFDAAALIRLYAEGGSTLRFRGQVTLNAADVELAARQIIIDAGGVVDASGNIRIYTDKAEFDKAGRGTLRAGGEKVVRPHAERGGY